MKKIVFVILHYQTIKDTEECINSILQNINYGNFEIVIVDNFSTDGSGQVLKDKYNNLSNMHVILNNENLGFAKGNNIGFRFAKYELKAEFIIMINNDTLIKQKDFIDILIGKYKVSKYGVLGPDVISLIDNGHQNPIKKGGLTYNYVCGKIKKFKILYILNKFFMDLLFRRIYSILKKNSDNDFLCNYELEQEDITLHGSCLIFSPKYISKYDGLFDNTFMYWEESILYYIASRDKIKLLYTPNLKIYHKEDSATNTVLKNSRNKNRFFIKILLIHYQD